VDDNGIGDACEKSIFTLSGVAGGGGGAQASAGAVTSYALGLVCGASDVVEANLGIRIPAGVSLIDFAGCAQPDPNDSNRLGSCAGASPPELGPTVDPNRSFTRGPGVEGAPSDIFFLSLQGNLVPGERLCRAGDLERTLGLLQLTDVPTGTAPTLTLNGLDDVTLEPLVDPNSVAVARQNIELVSQSGIFDPNTPGIVLRVDPAPDDPNGLQRWQITLVSEIEIHRVVFGLRGPVSVDPNDVKFVGCETFSGSNNRRTCQEADPNHTDIGETIDFGDPNHTFTLGPDPAASPPLPSDLTRTLYVSLVGKLDVGAILKSLNTTVEGVTPTFLGILEYSGAGFPPPELITSEVTSLPGVTAAVVAADETVFSGDDVTVIDGFDAQDDTDADGRGDATDNCPFTPNSPWLDQGGVRRTTPDGFGDACQCGESTGNGRVYAEDVLPLQQLLAGLSDDAGAQERCSVTGGTECDLLDIVIVGRVTAEAGGNIEQKCAAANP
jgi:hypothetical protein